jgi:hypothetical protein
MADSFFNTGGGQVLSCCSIYQYAYDVCAANVSSSAESESNSFYHVEEEGSKVNQLRKRWTMVMLPENRDTLFI